MRSDILKILNDASNTECLYPDDFLHVADEIHKLYQPKRDFRRPDPGNRPLEGYSELQDKYIDYLERKLHNKEHSVNNKNVKELIEGKLNNLLKGNYLVNSSDKDKYLSEVTDIIRELVKISSVKFFYWWWNAKGNNTEQGFDEWWDKEEKNNETSN